MEDKMEDKIKEILLYKRILEWNENSIILEDGTTLQVECFDWDCCASGGGKWSNVKLDAVITDIKLEDVNNDAQRYDFDGGETCTTAKIMIYHNQNIIAQNEMYTDDGNGGYYYSVTGLLVTLPDKSQLEGFTISA